jgi:tyrosyl-tRNA synthetase
MTLSEELTWRGFVNQTTFQELGVLNKKPVSFYMGFDASADSQTVGNLAAMMMVRCFLRHGHKGYLIAGGATSLIGDPGGKDAERPLQDEKTIAHNVDVLQSQLKKVLGDYKFELLNNLSWTKDLKVLDFLRDTGKHFSMTPLVQRDYIAKRIGDGGVGISYTEFSYTLLQGYDYQYLYDKHGVTLQLGGSDQWGNCLSGVDLIRKSRGVETHVITLNLIINKATGKKFGKSEDGAVWLDPKKTTPAQFYQFWINSDDDGVGDYLKVFTELNKQEIADIMKEHMQNPQLRYAQSRLAEETTRLVHGEKEVHIARTIAHVLTGQTPVGDVDESVLDVMREEIGHMVTAADSSVIEALVNTGLATSNTEARRLLAAGAIYINGEKTTNEQLAQEKFHNGRLMLRRGKAFKDSALVELAK